MLIHKFNSRITINQKVLAGKPIIRGTRISVELILKLLAQGISTDEILDEYPRLKHQDVLAAINYAYGLARNEEVYPLKHALV